MNGNTSENLVLDINEGEYGNSTHSGYENGLNKFIDLIDERNLEYGLVNLMGIKPSQDVFWQGNLYEIKRILNRLGLKVNTLLDNSFQDAVSAELNIVLSPWIGINEAKKLEEKFGIPYIVNTLPIGINETNLFLNKVAKALWIDADGIIEEEMEKVHRSVEKVANHKVGTLRFATITDSNYGIALNRFLSQDFGWIPTTTVISDNVPHEFREVIRKQLYLNNKFSPNVIFETNPEKVNKLLENQRIDFLLGSSLNSNLAGNMGAANLSVSYPVTDRVVINRRYAGYNGTINIIEDLLSQLAFNGQN